MAIDPLTSETIAEDPDCITETVFLDSGEEIVFRVLRHEDGALLGRCFEGLLQETRSRFGPHPLTMEAGHQLCREIDYSHTLRLIALAGEGEEEEIVAYFILLLGVHESHVERLKARGISLDDSRDCTFAPCVADAYQNRGVGSALMPKVIDVARRLGRGKMVLLGGTQATNYRAIHFYEKFGFRKVGDFMTKINNHDMVLSL